jgi:hypothetical protein
MSIHITVAYLVPVSYRLPEHFKGRPLLHPERGIENKILHPATRRGIPPLPMPND